MSTPTNKTKKESAKPAATTPTPVNDQTHEEEHMLGHDIHTLLSWHAPGRPFRQRSLEYFINVFLIMLALEIILFLFSQYLLMLVVFSLVFLAFALAIVPPPL